MTRHDLLSIMIINYKTNWVASRLPALMFVTLTPANDNTHFLHLYTLIFVRKYSWSLKPEIFRLKRIENGP